MVAKLSHKGAFCCKHGHLMVTCDKHVVVVGYENATRAIKMSPLTAIAAKTPHM